MIRCIAIDDEPLALRKIRTYVSRIEELELVGEFRSTQPAAKLLQEQEVELVFCDINMPDMSGIEFIRNLESEHRPLVVFTTAYSEYAVEGFRLEALDYLLKPFSFDDFNRSVQRAATLLSLKQNQAAAKSEAEETTPSVESDNRKVLTVKTDHMVSLVQLDEIVYLESMGEYIRIHLANGKVLTTLYRMKNMEVVLPAESFMRVHRSYIVNLKRMVGYAKGRIFFTTDEPESVPIGENYREAFTAYTEKTYNMLNETK
jgi:two-component system LytT family response regulator